MKVKSMEQKNSKSFAKKLFKTMQKSHSKETLCKRYTHRNLCSLCKLPIIEEERLHRFKKCKHYMCLNCHFYVKKCFKCYPNQTIKKDFDLGKYTKHLDKQLFKKNQKIKKRIEKKELDKLIDNMQNLTITKTTTTTIKIKRSKSADDIHTLNKIDNILNIHTLDNLDSILELEKELK